MAGERTRLWDRDVQRHYWDEKDRSEREWNAHKNGEASARRLADHWRKLSPEEKALVELMVRRGKRQVVALYEDALIAGLVRLDIFRPPPGVGTLLIQRLETTFHIPNAVWDELARNRQRFFAGAAGEAEDREAEIAAIIGSRTLV